MATGSGEGGGGGDKETPTYEANIETISTSSQEIQEQCATLVLSAEAFSSTEGFVGEDETIEKLPEELNAMVGNIYSTFESINNDVYPLLKDTSGYDGEKVLWKQLTENYTGAVEGVKSSLEKLIKSTGAMVDGKKYDDVSEEFSAGIVGIGDNLNAMHGNVIAVLNRKNKGNSSYDSDSDDYLYAETEKKMETFDAGYSTIASHMFWGIYSSVYMVMGLITICIGLLLCFISKPLTKLMHGVE
jgi:hypothetical protein